MRQMKVNPVLVHVTRGDMIESHHRGAVAVVDDNGRLVASWGDVEGLIYPRSAVKPFQAMACVESGAFDAFGLGEAELALHCASHNGEEDHAAQVKGWLDKIDLGVEDLECGSHLPMWITKRPEYHVPFAGACPLHNNCSGKHAGFLTTARHMNVPTADYINPHHPVQKITIKLIAEMTGFAAEDMPIAMDACRAPTFGLPMAQFAHGLARLGTQKGLSDKRAEAAFRVIRAMRAFPWNVAGTGRPETLLMEDGAFTGIAKCGAEGVYAMSLPDQGLGLVVKVDDGSDRAAHVMALATLKHLGILKGETIAQLAPLVETTLYNWAEQVVGVIRPAPNIF